MIYYKKNENTRGERISIPNDFPFDGIVIFGDYERSESMKKKRNAVKAIVISAICVAAAAAFFVIRSRADKPKV